MSDFFQLSPEGIFQADAPGSEAAAMSMSTSTTIRKALRRRMQQNFNGCWNSVNANRGRISSMQDLDRGRAKRLVAASPAAFAHQRMDYKGTSSNPATSVSKDETTSMTKSKKRMASPKKKGSKAQTTGSGSSSPK
jgi:hypothetical protein